MIFRFVTRHACEKQTDRPADRITITKTALAQLLRAVKTRGTVLSRGIKISAKFSFILAQSTRMSDRWTDSSTTPTTASRGISS